MEKQEMPWFAFYAGKYSPLIRLLDREQLADLLLAVDAYAVDGELKELDKVTNMAFTLIRSDVDSSRVQLEKTRESNRQNALKRWNKQPDALACDGMRSDALACDGMRPNANHAPECESCEPCTEQYNTEHNSTLQKKRRNNNRHVYGEYKHVTLSDSEKEKLVSEYGEEFTEKCIERLDKYIEETGKTYKNCSLTIKRWVVDAVGKDSQQATSATPAAVPNRSVAEQIANLQKIQKQWESL